MMASDARHDPVPASTRRWGAQLCLASEPDRLSQILSQAFLDLGYESISVLQRDDIHGVSLHWSRMGGETVAADDAFAAAKREVLTAIHPRVHDWIARQDRVLSQVDFLALEPAAYRAYLELPQDFGYAPWRTKLSFPFRGDSRGLSVGIVSTTRRDLDPEHVDELRFLARLYCTVATDRDPDREAGPSDGGDLNARQIECLRWAAAGKSYDDIADILGVTERAVRYHLNGARRQYGMSTVIQTIVRAAQDYDFDPMDGRG